MTDERQSLPSASEMYRIAGCAGYLSFARQHGKTSESQDAALGTAIHEVLKNEGVGADTLPTDHARWIVSKSLELRESMAAQVFGSNPIEVLKECRFWSRNPAGDNIFSGKGDWVGIDQSNSVALVVDYKSLYGDTDAASENWQLMTLAACLEDHFNHESGTGFATIYGAIIQPAVNLQPELVAYSHQQVVDAGQLIRRKLREAAMPFAPRIPGNHCKFCPAAHECPEAQSTAAVIYHSNLIDKVSALSPTEISRLLPTFPTVLKVMEKVKERAKELAEAGELPGYELRDGYEVTTVTDIPGFFEALQAECGITKDEFFRNLNVTKDGLEQIFRDRWSVQTGLSKRAAAIRFKEIVATHGTTCKQKPRLAEIKQTSS